MHPGLESTNQDKVSLREVLIQVQAVFAYLLAKWKLIVCLSLLGALLGIAIAFLQKPKYAAMYTFVVEESGKSAGGLGAYAGIASQLGINLGGMDNGGNLFAGDNIIEFMRSRKMIENTLLSPVLYNGKKELLVNVYAEVNQLREKWDDDPKTAGLSFKEPVVRNKFTVVQDSVLGKIYESIVKEELSVDRMDKKLSIIRAVCVASNQQFAKLFIEELVDNVSDFYITTKTKKLSENVNLLQSRTDSVRRALDAALRGSASFADENVNLVSQSARLGGIQSQRQIQVLGAMYTELVKNLEIAKFTLLKEQPLIQTIDQPILPLRNEKLGKLKGAVLGAILTFLLTLVSLLVQRGYKHVMAETVQ